MDAVIISHWRATESQRSNQTAGMSNVSKAQYNPLMLFWGILWICDSDTEACKCLILARDQAFG